MNAIDRWVTQADARGGAAQLAARLSGAAGDAAGRRRGGAACCRWRAPHGAPRAPAPGEPDPATPAGDPGDCDYWRHCAIDGFLCGCCGGSQRSCPPGTEQSPVTWIGTCRNPADGKDYIISYNDCCGKHVCGLCFCHRNEGDKPIYFPPRSNDINWCFGTTSVVYNCSTAIVLGVATEK